MSMENFWELNVEEKQNWLRGVLALMCLRKPLEHFIDKEIAVFHRELREECGTSLCVKNCDFTNWKPRPNQIPPLDCEVCSHWKDAILANHTSQHGKVMWLNSKPHQWSQNKWEVAKVYMPGGHKNHNSIDEFDIAALLCLMNQCKHFKKFELGGLCDKVTNVRNQIMHAPRYQLKQEHLDDYFNRIRELSDVLGRHDLIFKSLSEDISEIQGVNYRVILPDDMDAQRTQAQDEKELENIHFAVAHEAAEHHLTRMKLEKLERLIAQQEQDSLIECYALIHKPRGLCVVINNEDFLGLLTKRRGTQEDARALRTVFTRLGFEVVVHDNLTADAMRLELRQLSSRNFLDDDALVVCVLTHGEKGYVFGTDMQRVSLQELTRPFTSRRAPTLAGKPKLFFIQACQGSSTHIASVLDPLWLRQEEGDRQRKTQEVAGPEGAVHEEIQEAAVQEDAVGHMQDETMPYDADFLVGMATMPEYRSFRHTSTGSIYIQELCKQLTRSAESLAKDDILAVLTCVNSEVSKREYLNCKQIPEPKYTLTKKLVLKYM